MSLFSKDSLIPLTSLLAGMLVTSLFFVWQQQPSPDVQAAIVKFDELPESQQTNVQNIAAEYLKDPAYQRRIQAIHVAVEKDPALLEKLHQVDSLLKSQDPQTRARLLSKDGNWLQQVEDLHRRQTTTGPMVKWGKSFNSGRGEGIDLIAEKKVVGFLDAIIDDPVPGDLAAKLAALDSEKHQDEQILAKIIWLVKKLQPDVNGRIYAVKVVEAGKKYMARPDIIEKMEEQIRRWPSDEHVVVNRMVFNSLLRPLFKHYEDRFNKIHVPANSDAVEIFDGEIDRRRQLELMRMDPTDARSQLSSEIIRHMKVPNPAIESLNQELKELPDLPFYRMLDSRWRGGFGGGRSGFSNRLPQGGGRNGNDRDKGPPHRERPPGDDRGRPPQPRN